MMAGETEGKSWDFGIGESLTDFEDYPSEVEYN
jgi:hypothetical protein